ncbi:TlpA disulfide reductase family protein [Porphyromonas sp.]|uniref:TlpA disulfide reductase family protein n=1 Tax=Porphyromonas sp. TaxID=1924944 RepID=UPI0026DC2533|nr:TlpA disulfide reductase family protein [Porphyromonas sp.]MDO4770445.1 TlpA disulfide reductase family protein [Porphyromonas sp.]
MKKNLLFALSSALVLASCAIKTDDTKGMIVEGTVTGLDTDKLIVGKAVSQAYDYIIPADTVKVIDGKFEFSNDTLEPGVYGFYVATETPANNTMVYAYLDKGTHKIDISLSKHNFIQLRASGVAATEEYQAWEDKLYREAERAETDSLDNLFYTARREKDQDAMAKIKESSMESYRRGSAKKTEAIRAEIAKERKDAMGIYLYYTHVYSTMHHGTLDEINNTRAQIESFDESAKATHYYQHMLKELANAEQSVIGAVAPDFAGEDAEGNPMKLSDLRGKYVLVDFWSSGCTWCRAETPNIVKTYEDFKDKNFTVLAASLDVKKEDWIKAMKEDGLYWPSLLMSAEDRKAMGAKYNVKGIPLILLVDTEGKILARDLRGQDIYNAVKEHVK